jgi:hypothetical protein
MHARAVSRAMQRALWVLVLLAPVAGADPIGQCTQFECARVEDADGDGAYDWANFAAAPIEQVILNANVNHTRATFFLQAGTEELVETYHNAAVDASLNATDGLHDADVFVYAYEGDEETGETTPLVWRFVRASDGDGDGVPETVTLLP